VQRHLEDLIPLSRRALASALSPGRTTSRALLAVDATAGNGHDTLFLAERVGEGGRVWAFDVQRAALDAAQSRIAEAGFSCRVCFVLAGHESAGDVLPKDAAGKIRAATFNLGFLPGSDRRIVTGAGTTLAALNALAALLAQHGILSVHSYSGHAGGEDEAAKVARWFRALPWDGWRVAEYSFCNKNRNREILFLAEKIS